MTVIISKDPRKIYQSIAGLGLSEEELRRADELDLLVKTTIEALINDLKNNGMMPENQGEGSLGCYWKLGKVLRKITEHDELFKLIELPLLWLNAKMYIPQVLLYKDRGPHREHLWYCYRLASYSIDTANKMNWSEWVTIFDSAGINQEQRFDTWFETKLSGRNEKIKRSEIRHFVPLVNAMLKDIEISELSNTELSACYEACWCLMQNLGNDNNENNRFKTAKAVVKKVALFESLINGTIDAKEYANKITVNL